MAESNVDKKDSDRLERGYYIREITHMQASWIEKGRGEDGKFTVQLVLDNGVEEYILEPSSDDIDTLLKLFKVSGRAMFDMNRKIIIFNNLAVKG